MANILYIMTAVIFQSLSYLTVLTLLVITLSSESKWFCFAGIMSTVVISVIASHIGKQADEYNVMMQFIFWLIEWGILGWFQSMLSYTGTSGTIDVFAIVEGASLLFPIQDLPIWVRWMIIVTTSILSIVFLEIVFHGIIGHSGGNLGMFGRLYEAFWGWVQFAWTEVQSMWDITGQHAMEGTEVSAILFEKLCRICGVRGHCQLADDLGGHELELQVLPQMSGSLPYPVSPCIIFKL